MKKKKEQKCPKYSGIKHAQETQTTPTESSQAFARAPKQKLSPASVENAGTGGCTGVLY
jgi:hypothetical protein